MPRILASVILTALAVAWAVRTGSQIHAAILGPPWVGIPLFSVGILLIVLGLADTKALYRVFPHPISVGAILAAYGVSTFSVSSSGFWLVCPTIGLISIAHIVGRPHLQVADRFLPPDTPGFPGVFRRFRFQWNVILPWFGLYELCASLGVPRGSMDFSFPFEHALPILPWTELVYFSTYAFVIAAPFFVPDSRSLRRLTVQAWVAMVLVFPVYLTIPTEAARKPLPMDSLLSPVLAWERGMDPASLAFPSFHTTWAFLIAAALPPRHRLLWKTWAIGIALSCITTGMHSILDVVAGWALAEILLRYERIWPRVSGWFQTLFSERRVAAIPVGIFIGMLIAGAIGGLPGVVIGFLAGESVARIGSDRYPAGMHRFGCSLLGWLIVWRLSQIDAPILLIAGAALILRGTSGFIAGETRARSVMIGAGGGLLTCIPSASAMISFPVPLAVGQAALAAGMVALAIYYEWPKPFRPVASQRQSE